MRSSIHTVLGLLSPSSAPRRGLFLLMTAAVIGIGAVFVIIMAEARADAWRAAETSGTNLATALAQDMDHNIELLDLSIQAARDAWLDSRVRGLNADLLHAMIFDRSAAARSIAAILITDRSGTVVADSLSTVPRPNTFRDADLFLAQADRDVGLFIGRPMRVPGGSGWCLALSRRITAGDGSFAGVVIGLMHLDYLADVYKHLPLGPGGILALSNLDGTLLVREPETAQAVGLSFIGTPTFEAMKNARRGTIEGVSTLDGLHRLYSFQPVGQRPLIQAVAVSTTEIYAAWRAKAIALGGVLALLCTGMVGLLFVLKGELAQRVAAEAALDALASTDHLTGLLSRRKFFEQAEAHGAGAVRQGRPVSVLMIDVDHFKSYNDRYGHVAGDGVLAAIGRCIASGGLRGPGDLAARYGGEEFILLLGCDRSRAFAAAEAIRTAVARMAIPHARATAGIVTVSGGLACVEGGMPFDLQALVEAADAELYRSKREGRNRSSGGVALARHSRPMTPDALSA